MNFSNFTVKERERYLKEEREKNKISIILKNKKEEGFRYKYLMEKGISLPQNNSLKGLLIEILDNPLNVEKFINEITNRGLRDELDKTYLDFINKNKLLRNLNVDNAVNLFENYLKKTFPINKTVLPSEATQPTEGTAQPTEGTAQPSKGFIPFTREAPIKERLEEKKREDWEDIYDEDDKTINARFKVTEAFNEAEKNAKSGNGPVKNIVINTFQDYKKDLGLSDQQIEKMKKVKFPRGYGISSQKLTALDEIKNIYSPQKDYGMDFSGSGGGRPSEKYKHKSRKWGARGRGLSGKKDIPHRDWKDIQLFSSIIMAGNDNYSIKNRLNHLKEKYGI